MAAHRVPGARDCVQWLDEERLGLVFNTNAVGILSLGDPAELLHGTGDPTGTDSGPPWGVFPSGRWLVGFSADYRTIRAAPLALWDPSTDRLARYVPAGPEDEFARYVPVEAGLLGIRIDRLAMLDETRTVDWVPQTVYRASDLPTGPATYGLHAREHASPDGRWVIVDRADGVWLHDGADLTAVRELAGPDPERFPAAFAWSPDGARVAVAWAGVKRATAGHTDVFPTGGGASVRLPAARSSSTSLFASYHQPIAFSADGRRLAVLQGSRVQIHDATSGAELSVREVPAETLHLATAAGGALLALGDGALVFARW